MVQLPFLLNRSGQAPQKEINMKKQFLPIKTTYSAEKLNHALTLGYTYDIEPSNKSCIKHMYLDENGKILLDNSLIRYIRTSIELLLTNDQFNGLTSGYLDDNATLYFESKVTDYWLESFPKTKLHYFACTKFGIILTSFTPRTLTLITMPINVEIAFCNNLDKLNKELKFLKIWEEYSVN
jgi:hypothetical protein